MRKRLTITLKKSILEQLDAAVDGVKIRNRSHAIEYFLNKAFYASHTQAVILAGGKGSRMRPYTYEMPKSMLPVKEKPLLEYVIVQLRDAGIKDIIMCIGEQGSKIKNHFGDGSRFEVRITYIKEDQDLGTGGALKNARKHITSSPFIVVHADLLTDIDLKDVLSHHQQGHVVATMALAPIKDVKRFGQIKLRGNIITAFYQGGAVSRAQRSNLINAGIYVFGQEIFKYFPAQKVFSLEQILTDLVDKRLVSGYVFDGMWFDVGTPEDYEKALKAIA